MIGFMELLLRANQLTSKRVEDCPEIYSLWVETCFYEENFKKKIRYYYRSRRKKIIRAIAYTSSVNIGENRIIYLNEFKL